MPQILTDLIEFDFWRRAVIGGFFLSVACSMLSVYVVLKRMSFIGQGISHSAFGGVALGALLFASMPHSTLWIQLTAFLFCSVVALAIAYTTRRGGIAADSAIGVFFAFSMALGVIFLKQTTGFTQDAYSLLFGSILAISATDLYSITAMSILIIICLFVLRRQLLYYTFDEDMATVSGIRTNALQIFLFLALAVLIITGVRMIGIILISAFLVFPGATAWLVARRFNTMMGLAVISGVGAALGGLALAWTFDWPAGAAIVIVQFAFFCVCWVIKRLKRI